MAFFAKFPVLSYDFNLLTGGKVAEPKIVTDIFKRIAIKQNLENVAAIFLAYTVKDEDTPDIIADKLYGSTGLHWLVMLPNQIINPYFDWPMSERKLQNFLNKTFTGSTFFWDPASIANGNFIEGLPVGTTTSSVTGMVTKVDVTLSSLVVEDITFDGVSWTPGDSVVFEEGDTLVQDVGTLTPVTAELTRNVTFTKDALHHFEDAQGKELNPLDYRQGYIQGGFGFPPVVNVVTNEDDVRNKNEAKRNIQLIDPAYIDILLRDLETIFRRNTVNRRT